MKIIQTEIYKSPIRLKEPFIISLGPLECAENVVVRIRTDEGLVGMGECSPFMTINGENMETGFVVGQYLGKVLLGKNPLDLEGCMQAMDKLIFGNSSIKSAFDIALHDIAAQYAGLPLYRFLSGENNKTLYTDYTVSIGAPEKMATDALKIKQDGFQVIKLKLGGSREEDLERVIRIREQIGSEIPLRLDANQGWDTETAIAILKALEPYNIQFCEEPIARWNFMELGRVTKESPIPVMADECCSDHNDAKRLIDLGACDCFNIKLGKSSGLLKAQKIVKLAEQAGMLLQVGGFLESRLAFTASAHLALCSDRIQFCDFDTPLMFVEDPVEGGIRYSEKGRVTVPETPGLGASMNEEYLRGLEKAVVC